MLKLQINHMYLYILSIYIFFALNGVGSLLSVNCNSISSSFHIFYASVLPPCMGGGGGGCSFEPPELAARLLCRQLRKISIT